MAANAEILAGLSAYVSNKTGGGGKPTTPTTGPTPPPKKNPSLIDIIDARKISPTTGKPFKEKGGKTISADPAVLKAIIAHAKAKGVDPYTALSVAMQETEFGKRNQNWGSAWSYNPDKSIDPTDINNTEGSRLANALKDKLAYGAQLQKQGKIKPGESFAIQAYNGYGDLRHNLVEVGGKKIPQNYYGVTVTPDTPMLMSQNPLYGKTIQSLRDQVLRTHAGIKQLVDLTPAYVYPAPTPFPVVQK